MDKKDIKTKIEEDDSEDFGLNTHYYKEEDSTDNIKDYDEDIPFPEHWKRVNVDTLKQYFSDWLDDNIEHEYMVDPEFYLKDDVNEKRFYLRVVEQGFTNEDLDEEGYRCVFVPFETKRVEMTDVEFQFLEGKERGELLVRQIWVITCLGNRTT